MANPIALAEYGLGLLSSFVSNVDVVGIYANGYGNTGGATSSGLSSSVINSLTGQTGVTADFGQMFVNARPLKAYVRETSKVLEHPAETGVTLADHHIINPVEIDLQLMISAQHYSDTFSQMRQAFINATLLTIKTRVGTYSNMIVADMPHQEDADMYDAIIVNLRLRQVLFVMPWQNGVADNFQPADPLDSDTVASGLQSALSIGSKLAAAAGSVSSYAALLHKGIL